MWFLTMCFYRTISRKVRLVSEELPLCLSFVVQKVTGWLSTFNQWMFALTADDRKVLCLGDTR